MAKNNGLTNAKSIRIKFFLSLFFLFILLFTGVLGSLLNLKFVNSLRESPSYGYIQAALTFIILLINYNYFTSGIKALFTLKPNMDTLVALGAIDAFGFSMYVIFSNANDQLFFEAAAIIVTVITLGKLLEEDVRDKTSDVVNSLFALIPETVTILENDFEKEIPTDQIHKNDIFILKPGQYIPVDGIIVEGTTSINETTITGESIPLDKKVGDEVISGTYNINGMVKCRAVKVGVETTISQIITLAKNTAETKVPVQKVADKVSSIFVPVVILLAIVTFAVWMLLGSGIEYSVLRGISVLIISCPCALALATPIVVKFGSGVAAKHGVIFKDAVGLQRAGMTKIVVLGKTGTITQGNHVVKHIIPSHDVNEEELVRLAASVESASNHPLAKSIVAKAKEMNLDLYHVTGFAEEPGNGVTGYIQEHKYFCGRLEDSSLMCVKRDDVLLGAIMFRDEIREGSKEAIDELKSFGIKVVMLTGDNIDSAKEVARELEITEVYAQIRPEDKEKKISELKKNGIVMMVGDGINDAPALMSSDVGVAVGAGSDIALDSADVVLMGNSLKDVCHLIRFSRRVDLNIRENLFWALVYNCLVIPLAAGLFLPLFGWSLNPIICAAAMSISSLCVVLNSIRIRWIKK